VVHSAELDVCITVRFKIVRIYAKSMPRQRTRTQAHAEMTTPLADSGINDRLVKLRPLIDQTCFEFIKTTSAILLSCVVFSA